jgi:hypothetical protein
MEVLDEDDGDVERGRWRCWTRTMEVLDEEDGGDGDENGNDEDEDGGDRDEDVI